MKSKKTAKQIVDEVVAKVNEEVVNSPVVEEKPKKEHYYLCNISLGNFKPCNCAAFI